MLTFSWHPLTISRRLLSLLVRRTIYMKSLCRGNKIRTIMGRFFFSFFLVIKRRIDTKSEVWRDLLRIRVKNFHLFIIFLIYTRSPPLPAPCQSAAYSTLPPPLGMHCSYPIFSVVSRLLHIVLLFSQLLVQEFVGRMWHVEFIRFR